MATKAERFRYEEQRSGPKKEKRPVRPRRDNAVDTSLPGVSATDRKIGGGWTIQRNYSKRVDKQGLYMLENSNTGKASRVTSRKGASHAKPGHPLRTAKVAARLREGLVARRRAPRV